MVSPQTTERLLRLRSAQGMYRPRPEIASHLRNKVLLIFNSPSAGGKNTLMEAAAAADSHFDIVGNQTSRQPRNDDGPHYTYFQHTDSGLQPLFDAIDSQEVVQYAVSLYEPYNIYATTAKEYETPYCMKDVFFDAISPLRKLPFKRVVVLNLVTSPDVYMPRFDARFPAEDPNRPGRTTHAIKSLEWSLSQPDSADHVWVENSADMQATVETIRRVAEEGYTPDARRPRTIAQETLRKLQELTA